MSRGLSTTADVLVCLVLVSAAATTLALPTTPAQPPDADAAATVVERTTTDIEYRLVAPAGEHAPKSMRDRRASGRLSSLLARSAVRNATVDGRQLTHTSDEFERRVAAAVVNATAPRTQVVARWRPFPGAAIGGTAAAGPVPPADATVASQTRRVATAGEPRRQASRAAEDFGYAGVAAVAASRTTERLWPPTGMQNALAADYPTDRLAVARYEAAGRHLGVSVEDAVAAQNATAANSRLRETLQRRYETQLRERFDSPQAAARALQPGVTLVVRRWSA
ncbi:DUF7284 family protein [Halosegnis longus]|uniref:Uncharacterized protein n=1 Tax=Halosegnis longus TaxID=2216012 RepID=A0AAJ4RA62_9EURY|nr:hypothetical protein [Halosegnis longus]RNJ26987.1 hypothetical protein Nmn1133_10025 [Salella cibi]